MIQLSRLLFEIFTRPNTSITVLAPLTYLRGHPAQRSLILLAERTHVPRRAIAIFTSQGHLFQIMRWRVLSCILAFFLFITLILLARNGEGEKLQLISWLPSMTSSRKRFFICRLLFEIYKSSSWAWLEIKGWTSNILYISYIFWCIAMQKYWFTIYPACMLKACGLGNKTISFGRGGLSFLKEFPLSPAIYPAFLDAQASLAPTHVRCP